MQGDPLLPELRDVEEGGDDVATPLIVDQHLPLIRPLANLACSTDFDISVITRVTAGAAR